MSVISDGKTCNLNEERFSSHTCVANNAETAEDGQSLGLPSKATSFQPAWLRSGNVLLAGLASGGAELCSAPELPGTCCLQAQLLRSRLSGPPWQSGHRGYGKVASCRPKYMRASFHSASRGE